MKVMAKTRHVHYINIYAVLGYSVSSTNEPDHQYIAVGNHYITNQCLLKIALFVLRNIAYNFILHLTDHCQ
jgi:hypothetical protein